MGNVMAWIWIILGLLYLLSPYDLLPDFIPLRGWIDDLFVLFLLVRYVMRIRQAKRYYDAGQQGQRDDHGREGNRQADTNGSDPYKTLGISPGANREEIHSAYRKLANQYHPDKVAHLGAELQELAEKRFKEIQNAYEALIRK